MTRSRPLAPLCATTVGFLSIVSLYATVASAQAGPGSGGEDPFVQVRRAVIAATASLPEGAVAVHLTSQLTPSTGRSEALVEELGREVVRSLQTAGRAARTRTSSDGSTPVIQGRRDTVGRLVLDLRVRSRAPIVEITSFAEGRPEPAARGHAYLRVTERVRELLGPPADLTPATVRSQRAHLPGRGYLAIAVHDFDGDGLDELVGVTRDRVQVMRWDGGPEQARLSLLVEAEWPTEIPLAPTRPRRAIATTRSSGRRLVVRTGHHALPVSISFDGRAAEIRVEHEGCRTFPASSGCLHRVEGRDYFQRSLARAGSSHETTAMFYAHALATVGPGGRQPATFEALVTPRGRLIVRVHEATESERRSPPRGSSVGGVGSALAMADLDADGAPELLTSHGSESGASDQISVLRALPRGTLRGVWRSQPLDGAIWTAAAGDIDGDGMPELLAVEEPRDERRGHARLWVVQ